MKLEDVVKYMKNMSISIVMMLLLAYGMATNNPWLQPLYIILIMFALQIGYQIIKTARSSKAVAENTQEASRAKRGMILFRASEGDVSRAKGSGDEGSTGTKMLIMILAPMSIFIALGYVLNILVPGIVYWQSYMIAFLPTMLVSTFLTAKILRGATTVTPGSYIVGEKGIAFDHLGQSFILRFHLTKLEVQKEKKFIEAEGKAEASIIPNRLRLFTDKIDQLNKILARHVVDQEA